MIPRERRCQKFDPGENAEVHEGNLCLTDRTAQDDKDIHRFLAENLLDLAVLPHQQP